MRLLPGNGKHLLSRYSWVLPSEGIDHNAPFNPKGREWLLLPEPAIMLKCHLSFLAAQITFRQARKGGQVALVAAVKLGV